MPCHTRTRQRERGPRYAELIRQRDPRCWDAARCQVRPGAFDGYQKDLFVFDPETLCWWRAHQAENELTLAVARPWAVACQGCLFVGGGYGFTRNSIDGVTEGSNWRNKLESYGLKGKDAEEYLARSKPGCNESMASPQCIAAISKFNLSLCGKGMQDAGRHTCLGLSRSPWSTAPPEHDDPDFDIGFGHAHERTFCIYAMGAIKGSGYAFCDFYDGPLSAQGLAVLEQLHLVDWNVLRNSAGPPPPAPRRNGERARLGLMIHASVLLEQGLREGLDRECVRAFGLHMQYSAEYGRRAAGACPVARSPQDCAASRHGQMAYHIQWLAARCEQGKERNARVLDALWAGRDRTPAERIVVDVCATQLVPPVWRRLCVPWKVYLAQLDVQILRPALGLPRQDHLSVFRVAKGETRAPELCLCDMPRFGDIDPMPLCFGPTLPDFVCDMRDGQTDEASRCTAVDQMHVNVFYGGVLCDASKVRVSDLLCQDGDALEWVYDLGQAHRYTVRLVQVVAPLQGLSGDGEQQDLAASESISVLDGAGNGLPNDCGSVEHMALLFNNLWRPDGGAGREEPHPAGARLADEGGGEGGGAGAGSGAGGGAVPAGIDRRGQDKIKEVTIDLDAGRWWVEYDTLRKNAAMQSESLVSPDYLSVYDPWSFDRARCAAEVRAACRSSVFIYLSIYLSIYIYIDI